MMEDFYRELEQSSLRGLFPADMVAPPRSPRRTSSAPRRPPLYQQRFGNPMMRAPPAFVITRERVKSGSRASSACSRTPQRYAFPEEHLPGFRAFLRASRVDGEHRGRGITSRPDRGLGLV